MDRREAFYFYFIQMPLKLFPATPFLVMGIWGFARYRGQLYHHRELGFALLWIMAYLFILHLTVAKNTRYLLPLYLPCAILSAWGLQYFLYKPSKALCTAVKWADRCFFGTAVLGLAAPFVIGNHYGASLLLALPYALSLGITLLLGRKFLPFKSAGLFVSFVILLLAIEAGDTVSKGEASPYYRMSVILKNENLETGQIAFHKCDSRPHAVMSFYFNKLLHCSDDWADIGRDPAIRAIVATRRAVERKISSAEIRSDSRIIPCDKGYVVVIKPR
jgi:hypothetical protein